MEAAKLAVSIGRINKFLNCEEVDEEDGEEDKVTVRWIRFTRTRVSFKNCWIYFQEKKEHPVRERGEGAPCPPPPSINFGHSTFSWRGGEQGKDGEEDGDFSLSGLDGLGFESGSLTAVVGAVGSGKSSLLSAILGEMRVESGAGVKYGGSPSPSPSVAYVPQQAWIQNLTLRDNILFGKEFQEDKYGKVLDGCALRDDLRIMPGGDTAEIGENGINLSGGQKQRVSLARAAYSDADVQLLDDPLSAVDAHVGRHLFRELIGPGGLLAGKTRVLVTHNLSFLDRADKIVLMDKGKVAACGSFEDLKNSSQEFRELLAAGMAEKKKKDEEEKEKGDEKDDQESNEKDPLLQVKQKTAVDEDGKEKNEEETAGNNKIVEEEVSAKGRVDFRHYLYFIRKTNAWAFAAVIILLLFGEGVRVSGSIILGLWTDAVAANEGDRSEDGRAEEDNVPSLLRAHSSYISAFAASAAVLGALDFFRSLLFMRRCAAASAAVHTAVLDSVMRSPMRFFDANPVGR